MTNLHTLRRKTVNVVMLTITGLCTLFAAGTLVYILGYLFVHGATSLSWNFFTSFPPRWANPAAHGQRPSWAAVSFFFWLRYSVSPLDFWAGYIWRNSGGNTFSYIVRYVTTF